MIDIVIGIALFYFLIPIIKGKHKYTKVIIHAIIFSVLFNLSLLLINFKESWTDNDCGPNQVHSLFNYEKCIDCPIINNKPLGTFSQALCAYSNNYNYQNGRNKINITTNPDDCINGDAAIPHPTWGKDASGNQYHFCLSNPPDDKNAKNLGNFAKITIPNQKINDLTVYFPSV